MCPKQTLANYWKFRVDARLAAVYNMRYPLPMFVRFCLWFLDSLIFDWRYARNRFANYLAVEVLRVD